MKVDEIIEYSNDYRELATLDVNFICSVTIDFDFAIGLPDMSSKVYYNKCRQEQTAQRLNTEGVLLVFEYNIKTRDILAVWVRFSNYCQVTYTNKCDICIIIKLLKQYKAP